MSIQKLEAAGYTVEVEPYISNATEVEQTKWQIKCWGKTNYMLTCCNSRDEAINYACRDLLGGK